MMFSDMMSQTDSDQTVLYEFLRYKGIINDNVLSWVRHSGPLIGEGFVKELFKDKTDAEKAAVCKFMENIPWEDHQAIVKKCVVCKKCRGKVEVKEGVLLNNFVCENCGRLNKREEAETDAEAMNAMLLEYAKERGLEGIFS